MDKTPTVTNPTIIETREESSASFWITLIVIIIILIVGGFLLYWFVFRTPVIPPDSTCQGQYCGNGMYCSSAGKCVNGTGELPGQPCSKNTDCLYGNVCTSGICVSNTNPPVTTLPSQFYLFQTFGNAKIVYYLDPNNSYLTTTKPDNPFSYDHANQILSFGERNINVTDQGYLNLASTGFPLNITGTNTSVQIRHPCGSILSYKTTLEPSISVSFPQSSGDTCPSTFQQAFGPVALTLNVEALNPPPQPQNSFFNTLFSYNNFPQNNIPLNNNNFPQDNWSNIPLNNNNFPQDNWSNIPLNNNNNFPQDNWSNIPLNNNLNDTNNQGFNFNTSLPEQILGMNVINCRI